jgi:hypothetical protein
LRVRIRRSHAHTHTHIQFTNHKSHVDGVWARAEALSP